MIKRERNTVTVYRKEEAEDGTYSMPLVKYTNKVKFLGLTISKTSVTEDVQLKVEYDKSEQQKPGF